MTNKSKKDSIINVRLQRPKLFSERIMMNKKIAAVFAQMGLSVNGNTAYGKYNGFEFNAFYAALDNVAPLKIHISCFTTDEQKRQISAAFRTAANKFTQFSFTQYGFLLGLNDWTVSKLAGRLFALIDFTLQTLKSNGALGQEYCPVCGKPLEGTASKSYVIDGFNITLEEDCVKDINKKIEAENADYNNAPNNYLKGFLGALIGGIVGAALCVGIYLLGYLSTISAIVSIALGAFLYHKFGGKQNWAMIVIVSLTTIACIIASLFGVAIIYVGYSYHSQGFDMSYIDCFNLEMSYNEEFSKAFYSDLIWLIGFTILGVVLMIFSLKKKIKRPETIIK